MGETDTQLVRVDSMLGVNVDLEQLEARYTLYEEIKKKLLNSNDYAEIKTQKGMVKAIRKSGWFKFSTAFGLSIKILEERRETKTDKPDFVAYHFKVQCISKDGRITEDVGSCDNTEENKTDESEHVIRAMAKTRATERAIILMVGANEIAAEDYESSKRAKSESEQYCTDISGKHFHDQTKNLCTTTNLKLRPST